MNDSNKSLFIDTLQLKTDAIGYSVSQQLAALYPQRATIEGSEGSFNLMEYAAGGLCVATPRPGIHSQITTS